MIVRWTTAALADLEAIENYQRLRWPGMRARFEARLTAIVRHISDFPLGAPEVEQRPGVRVIAFVAFPYRLFYRVETDAIQLLAIRHTSRQPLFE